MRKRGITQVSEPCRLRELTIQGAETDKDEARRWGVQVIETEVYGMIPVNAILESVAYYMQINDFDPAQVLELQLLELMGERAE